MLDVTAIIPARGGSVRLPHKNILPLCGKPLIVYSIEAWQQSRYFIKPAIVSTDDPAIADVARQHGAQVILRPPHLSQGDLPSPVPILQHVIEHLAKYEQRRVHWILLLQPTSPLRTVDDIDACLDIIRGNQVDSLTSVVVSECGTKENGVIYVTHADLVERGIFYGSHCYCYVMPLERSIDIDTQEDFENAELVLSRRNMVAKFNLPPLILGKTEKKRRRGRPKK